MVKQWNIILAVTISIYLNPKTNEAIRNSVKMVSSKFVGTVPTELLKLNSYNCPPEAGFLTGNPATTSNNNKQNP